LLVTRLIDTLIISNVRVLSKLPSRSKMKDLVQFVGKKKFLLNSFRFLLITISKDILLLEQHLKK
jgi:hypothetical protein